MSELAYVIVFFGAGAATGAAVFTQLAALGTSRVRTLIRLAVAFIAAIAGGTAALIPVRTFFSPATPAQVSAPVSEVSATAILPPATVAQSADVPTATPTLVMTATLPSMDALTATLSPTSTPTFTMTATPPLAPTATRTNTPTPTLAPTETPAVTAAPTLIPAGADPQWTPAAQVYHGVEMVYVPAGCFMMGSASFASDERPAHEVCLSAFWIDRYEVTNVQYGSSGYFHGGNRPRESVTWFQARDFCASRGARLPTEAEWEYAARGPQSLFYPWWNEFASDNAVFTDSSGWQTADAGSRPGGVSWVGAYDLIGNVWEWTSSIYKPYPYNAEDGRENTADTSTARVQRGGSWVNEPAYLRATYRLGYAPREKGYTLGFRCARSE